jgi:hypothetical protein
VCLMFQFPPRGHRYGPPLVVLPAPRQPEAHIGKRSATRQEAMCGRGDAHQPDSLTRTSTIELDSWIELIHVLG